MEDSNFGSKAYNYLITFGDDEYTMSRPFVVRIVEQVNYIKDRFKTSFLTVLVPDRYKNKFNSIFLADEGLAKINIKISAVTTGTSIDGDVIDIVGSYDYIGMIKDILPQDGSDKEYQELDASGILIEDDSENIEGLLNTAISYTIALYDAKTKTTGVNQPGASVNIFNIEGGHSIQSYIAYGFSKMAHGGAKLIMSEPDNKSSFPVWIGPTGFYQLLGYLDNEYGIYDAKYCVYWEDGICFIMHDKGDVGITLKDETLLQTKDINIIVVQSKILGGIAPVSNNYFNESGDGKVITIAMLPRNYRIHRDMSDLLLANTAFCNVANDHAIMEDPESKSHQKDIYKASNRITKKINVKYIHKVSYDGYLHNINPLTKVTLMVNDDSDPIKMRVVGYERICDNVGNVQTALSLLPV